VKPGLELRSVRVSADAAAYISQSQSKISMSLTNAKEKIEAEIRRAGYSF
jgi:hypothetical protein